MILDAVGLERRGRRARHLDVVRVGGGGRRRPDVLVLVDAAWNTAEAKIERLESNPATAEMTAVREGRYLTIPFPATEAGVRNVDAVVDLAAQLEALDL